MRLSNSEFNRLVSTYAKTVFNLSLQILGDTGEAEEVTQDVFMKVFTRASSFREEAALSTWLYRITTNTAITRIRRRDRRTVSLEDLPPGVPEPSETPESEYVDMETRLEMARSVGRLPSRQCHAIMLSYYSDYSAQEIAEILKISTNTLYQLLHRAHDQLRQQMRGK